MMYGEGQKMVQYTMTRDPYSVADVRGDGPRMVDALEQRLLKP
jgi:hypothetical protein